MTGTLLPHHTLIAYQVALELVKLVGRIRIRDAQLRAQARKSAASAALNAAEGAARQSLADKSRAYAIALAECCEACAAVEIAAALGACSPEHLAEVLALGVRLPVLFGACAPDSSGGPLPLARSPAPLPSSRPDPPPGPHTRGSRSEPPIESAPVRALAVAGARICYHAPSVGTRGERT